MDKNNYKRIILQKPGDENPQEDDTIGFKVTKKDPTGRSGSNPIWGIIEKDGVERRGLYKQFDYDFPNAHITEKIWSMIGQRVLDDVRVPDVEIVRDENGDCGIISYKILNNTGEDMTHIADILFNIYSREQCYKKHDYFTIDDVLRAIHAELRKEARYQEEVTKVKVSEEEIEGEYKRLESAVIRILLLDAITNNGDRHPYNWALVRNKETSDWQMGVFDHTRSFFNMIEKDNMNNSEWYPLYIKIKGEAKNYLGDFGNKVIDYISETYPDYFIEFTDKITSEIDGILEDIKAQNFPIDFRLLENKLRHRVHDLKRMREKITSEGDIDYD